MSDSTPTTESTPPPSAPSKWKLPEGIEDHIEAGLIKATAGIVVGGVVGMLMFRSGKGMRSACMATGLGVAAGSTLERYQEQYGPVFGK
eukprot:Nitzschia sp. Nitz4//scaffold218_size35881//24670//25022//NITZ4_007797-RA/size35881-snap-gene-0.30-mRNA-1//1//CDS//3329542289//2279//frame0